MNDLISRRAAIDWLINEWDGMIAHLFDGIEKLPSAQTEREDAAPKRRGRWVKNEVFPFNVYVCSVCDDFPPEDDEGQYLTPFCPYCGAEMENPE